MFIGNAWRRHGLGELDMLEGELIDVSACGAALAPFGLEAVNFHCESGLPWIEIRPGRLIAPSLVIQIGRKLEAALDLPVYFSSFSLHQLDYLVEGSFLLREGETYAPHCFEYARVGWDSLEAAWQLEPARQGQYAA